MDLTRRLKGWVEARDFQHVIYVHKTVFFRQMVVAKLLNVDFTDNLYSKLSNFFITGSGFSNKYTRTENIQPLPAED
jgi:hypothetical protein